MAEGGLIGREAEVTAVARALDGVPAGQACCVAVEGPHGSGRSAVVDAAIARFAGAMTVLRGAGSADDRLLPYAAFTDLCGPMLDAIDELPPTQAAALRGALALGPPTDDRLAVAAAFLALVHAAAAANPLLVVVEDADLLDDATAAAVGFAARRASGAIGLVVVQDPDRPTHLALPGALRVPVGPLAPDEARTLARRLASGLDPALVDVLVAASAGMPGRLLELLAARGSSVSPQAMAPDRTNRRGSHAEEAADHERSGRWAAAATAWVKAGDGSRALACADEAARVATSPLETATAEFARGRAEIARGRAKPAHAALDRAATSADAANDHVLSARCALLSVPLLLHTGDLNAVAARLERARENLADVSEETGPRRLLTAVETAVMLAGGEDVDTTPLIDLVDAGADDPDHVGIPFLVTAVALPLIWAERYDVAAHVLDRAIAVARNAGASGLLPLPLATRSVLERRRGHLDRALVAAVEAHHLATTTGQRGPALFALAELANVHAVRGDVDRCREAAEGVLGEAGDADGSIAASARSALATIELWLGRWDAVIDLLEPLLRGQTGRLSPVVTLYQQNLLTAYVFAGRTDDARRLLPALEAQAAMSPRINTVLERCRGLLAPPGAYDEHFRLAAASAPNPFARALSALFLAMRLASDGRHAEAITALSELVSTDGEGLIGVRRAASATLARIEIDLRSDSTDDPAAVSRPSSPPLVRLLGGLEIETADGVAVPPAGAPAVALAAVALRRSMHVEQLGDLLWPEADAALARQRLRNVLSRLRRSVGEVVHRHGDRVALGSEVRVDVHELDAAAVRTAAGAISGEALERAVSLYRGPLLPEFVYEDWTAPDRQRIESVYADLCRALADADQLVKARRSRS